MMMIRMGRAIAECSRGEKRPDDFAEAIITLTQQAVEGIFSNSPGGPEQMVVVMDCSGATSMQVRVNSKRLSFFRFVRDSSSASILGCSLLRI